MVRNRGQFVLHTGRAVLLQGETDCKSAAAGERVIYFKGQNISSVQAVFRSSWVVVPL